MAINHEERATHWLLLCPVITHRPTTGLSARRSQDMRNRRAKSRCRKVPPGSVLKELLHRLHDEVAAGRLTTKEAAQLILNDWRVAYRKYCGGT